MRTRGIILLVGVLLTLSSTASSDVITLTTTFIEVGKGGVVSKESSGLNVSIVNTGNVPALNVQTELMLPDGFTSKPVFPGTLEPNVTQYLYFPLTLPENVSPGRYPLVLSTHYTDANSYPFSTIAPTYFVYQTATPILLRGVLPEVTVSGDESSSFMFRIANTGKDPHNVSIRIYAPNELKLDKDATTVELLGREDKEVPFTLQSFGALPGSAYVILATAEYDEGGMHYSSLAGGMVKVTVKASVFELPSTSIIFGVAVLIVLAIVYLQIKGKGGKSGSPQSQNKKADAKVERSGGARS
ncbi:NPCBM-associated, NEW3 domain of alpha-galactosidase [uncultured archaeon]|nr:NPCBM-associated, NEW3 domain of alpha-galactosidase [uncultured archaeon]